MVAPIYPKALAGWTDRINGVDTVWANDPNSLAAEIISIEQTLGAMPQVERNVPVGKPVSYSSVSARISDAMLGGQLPFVSLTNPKFKLPRSGQIQSAESGPFNATYNTYTQVVSDHWRFFNGSDITIQAPGIYYIDASQSWENYKSGYVMMMLLINSARLRLSRWNWADYDPTSTDYASTDLHWLGPLNNGDRIRIASQNATSNNPYTVTYSNLRVQYVRDLPPVS